MKNKRIGVMEARDIEASVRRVLRELEAEPPLHLSIVRELLELDRHYFSSRDTGLLNDTVSRLRRAGRQLVLRPTLLLDAVSTAKLSALWLPDKKRILIDDEMPDLKKRWAESHEIGHSLTEWHRDFLLGDDRFTLSAECHETLEAEANYAAGELLFLQERFILEARSREPSLATIRELARTFSNTQTSTLWRLAEKAYKNKPLVGVICNHPHYLEDDFDTVHPCRYVVESEAFREQFSTVSEVELFCAIRSYCTLKKGGPLGERELPLTDVNGCEHIFHFETFFNRYDALTLGVYRKPRPTVAVAS